MSSIEWTDETWNPVVGCSRVSAGCEHCYAERVAHRGMSPAHRGLTVMGKKGPRWTGEVRTLPERLGQPLRWRKPRRVFVNSMSDLFHESVPFEFIAAVFGVMAACPQHTFQVLTKRDPRPFFLWLNEHRPGRCLAAAGEDWPTDECLEWARNGFPVLPNVWLGVSVEDQDTADQRLHWLLDTPAAVRWVSYEPALGPVDFEHLQPGDPPTEINALGGTHGVLRPHGGRCERLDWIVVGGESGPGARPFDLAWARSTIEQCRAAGVPCFVKQLGAAPKQSMLAGNLGPLVFANRKGGNPAEWPEDLRVREWPGARADGVIP